MNRFKHYSLGYLGLCLLSFLVVPHHSWAHHILGIPHYAYDEQYPQAPVLTYLVKAGPTEVKMTGYPGAPSPGEQCTFHVYIKELATGRPFDGDVSVVVKKDLFLSDDPVIYGPVRAELDQSVYKFYPTFDKEANYIVRVQFESEGAPWIVDLPVVVGEPGSPWVVLLSVLGGMIVFVIMIRAIRIKMKRKAFQDASYSTKPPVLQDSNLTEEEVSS